MITLRGEFLVCCVLCCCVKRCKTPVCGFKNASVCTFKKSPCVPAPRSHMFQHMCAWCQHTRGRLGRTHGCVFESTHGVLQRFTPQHKTQHTRHTRHTTHNTNNTQQHTTTTHGDLERRRRKKTERREEKMKDEREEKMRDKREDERQERREDETKEKRR